MRLDYLFFVLVEGDPAGGELDESEHRRAVRCRAFEHAADDGVVYSALLSGWQVAAVQELGQDGQAVGSTIVDLATHSASLCRKPELGDAFVTVTLLPPCRLRKITVALRFWVGLMDKIDYPSFVREC